ncbi:MAG: LexA family transcriptional regulator [Deltaproteobacteria bacterium]|nr:LexA family transcriptional regulator [Deltaproteobacteria bacterium]
METPNARLKKLRENLDLTQAELGQKIGLKWSQIRDMESGKVNVSTLIAKVLYYTVNANPDWILEGAKPMFLEEKGRPPEDFVYIPLYDVRAAAGAGAFPPEGEEVKDLLAFKREWIINELRVNVGGLSLLFVEGDSMTPTLNPGDVMLILKDQEMAIQDGIYVVRLEGALLVKRLQRLPGNQLKVKSDNPNYEPYTIDLTKEHEDFAVIGRMVWAGRRF